MATRTPPMLLLLFFFFKYSDSFKLTTELIHRDSIFSPFFNASETTADSSWRATRSSVARLEYFAAATSQTSPQWIEAKLAESMYQSVFYVKFSIGNPPVPQLAVMDTGSHFLWVKCLPCSPCSPIKGIEYLDPSKSTTFSPQTCTHAPDCQQCSIGKYSWSPIYCMYTIRYVGGVRAEGIYATDQLTFRTSTDQPTTIPNIRFGCTSLLSGQQRVDQAFNGVFGLGLGDKNALLSQGAFFDELGFQFSYCIGSLSDPSYPSNRLAFGDAAILKGKYTQFNTDYFTYNVQLHNITLGPKTLDIDIEVFRKMALRKRVIIDNGATLIYMYSEAFEVVKAAIWRQAFLKWVSVPSPGKPYELCYKGRVEKDAVGFPHLELHFAGGASLVMDNRGVFRQIDDDTFCMAIVRSEAVTIIGLMAQQRYNVGFDLRAKNMYFQYIEDCSVLDG